MACGRGYGPQLPPSLTLFSIKLISTASPKFRYTADCI